MLTGRRAYARSIMSGGDSLASSGHLGGTSAKISRLVLTATSQHVWSWQSYMDVPSSTIPSAAVLLMFSPSGPDKIPDRACRCGGRPGPVAVVLRERGSVN